MKKQLVIGLGEVGTALKNILQCDGEDNNKGISAPQCHYDIIHIAFPYQERTASKIGFEEYVLHYRKKFSPDLVIIHSSVPIGTSKKLDAVHSPIRGVHPNLEEGIRTFKKYFGGKNCEEAAKIFSDLNIPVFCVSNSDETEALKLWDTTQYGYFLILNKKMKAFCEEAKLNFDFIYTEANQSYNAGYEKLGRPEVMRPYLKYIDGKIGGHCIIENAHLLDNDIAQFIIENNAKL